MVHPRATSTDIFFALLRSGMYGIPLPEAELPQSIDWKAVVALARKHAVLGLIISAVPLLPTRLRPSPASQTRMNRLALDLVRANMVLDNAAARLTTFLAGHGIHGVLLKGQGVARYYPAPQARQPGDIDFYVGTEQYQDTVRLCEQYLVKEPDKCTANEEEFCFDMDGVEVEIHRLATKIFSPFRRGRFQRWIVDELEHSPRRRVLTVGETDVPLPSVDFDAIYVFYHAWRHYVMEGIGLRQLCDWAMILHSHGADIDTAGLERNIRRFGLTKAWRLIACIAVRHLGVAPDAIPMYDPSYGPKSEVVLDNILAGGNFGRYSKDYSPEWVRGSGFLHPLATVRVIAGYSLSLFPLMPIEAIALFVNYLFFGTRSLAKKTLRH